MDNDKTIEVKARCPHCGTINIVTCVNRRMPRSFDDFWVAEMVDESCNHFLGRCDIIEPHKLAFAQAEPIWVDGEDA